MTSITGSDGLTYDFTDGILTISGEGACTAISNGVVDDTLNAKTATELIIEEGITTLNGWASFRNMADVVKVSLPDSLTAISGSFLSVTSLRTVVFPKNLNYIGSYSFAGCNNLTELVFLGNQPSTFGTQCFFTETTRVMNIYTKGWGSSDIFTTDRIGSNTTTRFFTGTPSVFKHMTYEGSEIQVGSSERDMIGNVIHETYALKQSVPAAQVQSDWTQSDISAVDYIKNKPTIPPGAILYGSTGQNTDGAMTQKAATDALDTKLTALSSEMQFQRTQTGIDRDKYILLIEVPIYDSNITIEIWETADKTNHILLQVATQNKIIKQINAFSDFNPSFAGQFYCNEPTVSDNTLRIYYKPNWYTKIAGNIKCLYPGGAIIQTNVQLTTETPADIARQFTDVFSTKLNAKQDKLTITDNTTYYTMTY